MAEPSHPSNDPVGEAMNLGLARRIDEHAATHVLNVFIKRTGIARNRILRIRDHVRNPTTREEIRFSMRELASIARELRYNSLCAMFEDIESEALRDLDQHTDETMRRRRSVELAAMFLKLSDSEIRQIREALEMVSAPRV